MRMPWTRRAEHERQAREHAEKRLADVKADWPAVEHQTATAQRQMELNGWTRTIQTIFSGH